MVRSREERAEEGKTVQHFMKLIRGKVEASTAVENLAKGNLGPEYQAERSLLSQVNQLGWTEGQIAGAVTFLFLRRRQIGNTMGRFLRTRYNQLPPPPPSHLTTRPHHPALQVVQFTLDLSLSVIAAISVSLYFTDQDKLLSTVASIPLVPGRSVVADEFCPDICREYNQIHSREYWNQVESPILRCISTFCRNCQLRNAYQHKLRQEQGLGDPTTSSMSIPPPGVPLDYTFQENADSVSEETFGLNDFGQETTIVTSQDDDWAKSFVTDQEADKGATK